MTLQSEKKGAVECFCGEVTELKLEGREREEGKPQEQGAKDVTTTTNVPLKKRDTQKRRGSWSIG